MSAVPVLSSLQGPLGLLSRCALGTLASLAQACGLLLAAEALPVAAPLEPRLPCVAAREALLVAAPLEPHLLELLLEARALLTALALLLL